MAEKTEEVDIIAALRDVDDNNGHMEAPGTDAQIRERWKALKAAGYVGLINFRYRLTEAGRRALDEASHG
ncbi:MAG: hypothetical protein J0I42_15190 [Bosea sp.]|uniref:hypothetical protein n=1 Tax=Bosea sp. (in: a-proteobacteria) TaxID=1871050 RepID=UPI001AC702DC|nr:hypothetical protein [Bosea sp. (in: a-proteobacteria)]MBN9453292.1 hypothetical protein [Bosea sp. (in: a-proteobacteria)]